MGVLGPLTPLLDVPTWQLAVGGVALFLAAVYIYLYPYRRATLLFKNVPGPPSTSLFWGNVKEMLDAEPLDEHEKWTDKYGPTVRYDWLLGHTKLCSIDPRVMSTVLNDTTAFPKPDNQVRTLASLLGEGLLGVQHETHRRQRRVLAPAFGPAAIRAVEGLIWEKANQLRNKMLEFVEDESESAAPTPPAAKDKIKGTAKVDVEKYLAEMTLDVIGVAGFDYHFDSLTQPHNDLADAYHRTFSKGQRVNRLAAAQRFIPLLNLIPTEAKRLTAEGLRMTQEIGTTIVDRKKRDMEAGTVGKDLLSLLMKANSSPDIKPEDRLSDEQVMAQITTFMLAGNETSSTALTFTLWRLAQNPDIQARLRAELRAVPEERPTLDTLYKLPYLDNVVHESLRLDPPVPITVRTTAQDTTIPLSIPIKGRDGTTLDSVTINKGTLVDIPIITIHRSKELWGPDAREFNPDRWADGTQKEAVQGSVYGPLLTFLAGPRNCIGYRLALAEIKIALFTLLRTFEFDVLPSNPTVVRRLTIVQRPVIRGEEEHGNQMPLLVRLAPEE